MWSIPLTLRFARGVLLMDGKSLEGAVISRRRAVTSLGAFTVLSSLAHASQAVFAGKPTADTPVATVIPGKPVLLDFGDGLQIPCDKSAFLTLWDGKTFWLTFGVGRSSYSLQAQGQAVKYANAAMTLLIMTLAFAPDRMVEANNGWRMKPGLEHDWVRGDIKLPGLPYWPITDASFSGFGGMDSTIASEPSGKFGGLGVTPGSTLAKVDAFTTYIVLKRDLSLDDVRARAQILVE